MKPLFYILGLSLLLLSSCSQYDKLLKTNDLTLRYEMAKSYYYSGRYTQATTLLYDLLAATKGTDHAEEALFLLGMSAYRGKDYPTANSYFKKYHESYPRGVFVEEAQLMALRALGDNAPVPTLDQADTYRAIKGLQAFVENHPTSPYREQATNLIFEYQDRVIEKQFNAAKLYYDLGTYFGNCSSGGSNYQACIIAAQNAINDYPYSHRREDFAKLILKSKFELAEQSVKEKQSVRLQSALDEYQGFVNEYPNSDFLPKAKTLYEKAKKQIERLEQQASQK